MVRIARPKLRTLGIVALPVVAVAVAIPTVAMANGPTDVFKGCLEPGKTIDKVVMNPTSDPDCSNIGTDGTLISWNAQGVQGLQGLQGIQGVQGPAGTAGAKGAPGAAGAKGADGKNGVSGYRMSASTTKAAPRTTATYTVTCKDGRYAMGGGMAGSASMILNASSPTPDAKGWVVRATNVDTKAHKINVYVTCAYATN